MDKLFDLRLICQTLFEQSKSWWTSSIVVKLSAFIIGSMLILLSIPFELLPFIIVGLSISAELLAWQSDRIKSDAEGILRKLDFYDGLGWPISNLEISDIVARLPNKMRRQMKNKILKEDFFASKKGTGPAKVLENIQESAWWSKHLCEKAGQFALVITLITITTCIVSLIVSILAIKNSVVLINVSRVVSSAILLLFSLGLIRLTARYYEFSRKASNLEAQIEHLLSYQTPTEEDALRLTNEYHIARVSSPLIPTWIYRSMNANLNELWEVYRKKA